MKILREKNTTLADLLPQETMARLRKAGSTKAYTAGRSIQERGDTWQGVSIVNSGQVVVGNTGADGSFLASAILRPGECFGEFTALLGLPRTHSLWAQGACSITHIRRAAFIDQMDKDPAITRALLTLTLLRNYEMLDFLDSQRRLSLPARIARLLLTAAAGTSNTATVECRQEDLAVMLGLSRVAIGKALKRLEKQRLVQLGYGQICILDVEALRNCVKHEDQFLPIAVGPNIHAD
ncbi:Crp/Fnr family transcriptional regulator [Hyphomonas sp.]|uniref:Crp/Fnr family transcriptional regulator n=1 Tax=Hyphomonas sp. TaxID=87 RepID=UPI0025BB766B|nr:Crp/Fnr family transcriptional regulator [Hyphomonas sp.]MBI1401373.1 helix-turn-helix domain-containing protein [Hyphomonas sp.]